VDIADRGINADQELRMFLFEAAREMLLNVVKHAGTDAAEVHLERSDTILRLRVEDRGRGFDHGTPSVGGPLRGTGLFAISQRVELMGGRVIVASAPGSGTSIRMELPLQLLETEAHGAEPAVAARQREPGGPPPHETIQVVIADDHAVLRQGVASALSAERGIEVVGEAANGREAVERVGRLMPDVVLMDISMPEMDGIEATRLIHARFPSVRVIALSMHDEDRIISQMVEAGAAGFVTKGASMDEVVRAVRGKRGGGGPPDA
jgi:CheY-like chemotaxis protein